MIIDPLKGKYYAKDCDEIYPLWDREDPNRAINFRLESRLNMLGSTEYYNGLPEETTEEIPLDVSNSFLYYFGTDFEGLPTASIVPLNTARLSDQTIIVTFSWARSYAWTEGTLNLPPDTEIWVFLNHTSSWPTFWDGNLRPRGSAVFVPGPYS